MPKIAGVAYNRGVARIVCVPLKGIIASLYPIVWLTQRVSRILQRGEPALIAPEEEVQQMAALSAEEGSILPDEASLVKNVLQLDNVRAKDIMTPRTVVFAVADNLNVRQFTEKAPDKLYSRIPIYDAKDPENWTGVIRSQDILARLANDEFDALLKDFARPIGFVPEVIHGHKLLKEFLKRGAHILGVVDEYGSIVGVVTLEDIMESLIGAEILDETDHIADLQVAARANAKRKFPQIKSPRKLQETDEQET
jgi:CBS domain containing-hemolysin-like protein